MNVGQILETHLGWAARELGAQIERCSRRTARPDADGAARDAEGALRARTSASSSTALRDDDVVKLGAQVRARHPRRRRRCSTARREEEIFDAARAGRPARPPARRGSSTAAPASAFDARGDGRHHVHDEAAPPGRRQDPRPLDRSVLAGHAAAARRQGAVRRPAARRDGGVGARGLRRGVQRCRRC